MINTLRSQFKLIYEMNVVNHIFIFEDLEFSKNNAYQFDAPIISSNHIQYDFVETSNKTQQL